MRKLTTKKLVETKANRYTLIFFREGKRVLTYSNLDIVSATEELVNRKDGATAMMFESHQITAKQDTQNDLEFFIEFKKSLKADSVAV